MKKEDFIWGTSGAVIYLLISAYAFIHTVSNGIVEVDFLDYVMMILQLPVFVLTLFFDYIDVPEAAQIVFGVILIVAFGSVLGLFFRYVYVISTRKKSKR